jgi:hypothetical protein
LLAETELRFRVNFTPGLIGFGWVVFPFRQLMLYLSKATDKECWLIAK